MRDKQEQLSFDIETEIARELGETGRFPAGYAATNEVKMADFATEAQQTQNSEKQTQNSENTKIEAEYAVINAAEALIAEHGNPSRKPFRLTDFDPPQDREMAVFTRAKKLSEYIFVITEKSPKKFRWSIITRLQNTSTDVIELLYRANYSRGEERLEYQKSAQVSLSLLDFYAETARAKHAITNRQTAVIARLLDEVKRLLSGWKKSTQA